MRKIATRKLQCVYYRKSINEGTHYNNFFGGSRIPEYHRGLVYLVPVLGMYTIDVHINCSYTVKEKEAQP